MNITMILKLPLDIQLLILYFVDEKDKKDKKIIKHFVRISNNDIYNNLDKLIKKYNVVNDYQLLIKIKGALRNTYKLECLKKMI